MKDAACNYVFACGLDEHGVFHVGAGCGRAWCWQCGGRFCTPLHDMWSGARLPTARTSHDAACCATERGYVREAYCAGGHNSHCAPR